MLAAAKDFYFGRNNASEVEYDKAAECFEKAAALGFVEANGWLAILHLLGFGVKQDRELALRLLSSAMVQNSRDLFRLPYPSMERHTFGSLSVAAVPADLKIELARPETETETELENNKKKDERKKECEHVLLFAGAQACDVCRKTHRGTLICPTCLTLQCCSCLGLKRLVCQSRPSLKGWIRGASKLALDKRYHRNYCATSQCPLSARKHPSHTAPFEPLPGRLNPYRPPKGWARYSLATGNLIDVSDRARWQTVYHGLHPKDILAIVSEGFRTHQCMNHLPAVYFTPSIVYAAHPRYARVIQKRDPLSPTGAVFTQFVLEVRIDTQRVKLERFRETLRVGVQGVIDPDLQDNLALEYYVTRPRAGEYIKASDGIVVTGIMLRSLVFDPAALPSSSWWTCFHVNGVLHHYNYFLASCF